MIEIIEIQITVIMVTAMVISLWFRIVEMVK